MAISTQGALVYILITLLNEEWSTQEISSGIGEVYQQTFGLCKTERIGDKTTTTTKSPPGNQLLPRLPRVAGPPGHPSFLPLGFQDAQSSQKAPPRDGRWCHRCSGLWAHSVLTSPNREGACNHGNKAEVKTLIFVSPGRVQWLVQNSCLINIEQTNWGLSLLYQHHIHKPAFISSYALFNHSCSNVWSNSFQSKINSCSMLVVPTLFYSQDT